MVSLREDERLDYLLAEDMKIIQSKTVFAFSLDAVLLAKFAYVPIQKGEIIDLCTGNGIVPLLLSTRSKASITGLKFKNACLIWQREVWRIINWSSRLS